MSYRRALLLVVLIIAISLAIWFLESRKTEQPTGISVSVIEPVDRMSKEEKAMQYEPAREITTPDGFVNTQGITIQELIGQKVILVDFWTYSCINCQRTTPYLNAWYEKYRDQGLEIIGVHTPEFEFEKEYENVLAAVQKLGIRYPVVLDNDYSTWQAYRNRYWPRKYLIDIDGFIVYNHIGEGAYEETERKIQELLGERMAVLGMEGEVAAGTVTPQAAVEFEPAKIGTPEIYLGSLRSDPSDPVALEGEWRVSEEFVTNASTPAKMKLRYRARDVHFVASADQPVSIKVYKDGVLDSSLTVQQEGLYTLTTNDEYEEHLLEIIVEGVGLDVYTFTFG